MSEHDAFMQAIIEKPDDDTPRLVYADYLEEHGDPERAEFIRVQIELAMREAYAGKNESNWSVELKERMVALGRREKELLPTNAWDWAGEALRDAIMPGTHYLDALVFHRGFISRVTLPCADWLAHRETLLKAAPLEKVTLTHYGIHGSVSGRGLFVTPTTGAMYSPWLLTVRQGKLWFTPGRKDKHAEVKAISSEELRILFGNPNASAPQGIVNAPSH